MTVDLRGVPDAAEKRSAWWQGHRIGVIPVERKKEAKEIIAQGRVPWEGNILAFLIGNAWIFLFLLFFAMLFSQWSKRAGFAWLVLFSAIGLFLGILGLRVAAKYGSNRPPQA